MNTFICKDCHKIQALTCECGSGRLEILGDEHLEQLGVDAYLAVHRLSNKTYLLIKKPSGQVRIPLQAQDLIANRTP